MQGDCGEAGDGRDAHGDQYQAGVLVLQAGHFAHLLGIGPQAQPQHHQQVEPDAEVPASEDVLHTIVGWDQPATEQAGQRGEAQAGMGAGESKESHGASLPGDLCNCRPWPAGCRRSRCLLNQPGMPSTRGRVRIGR